MDCSNKHDIWTLPALQQAAPVKPKFIILYENPTFFYLPYAEKIIKYQMEPL